MGYLLSGFLSYNKYKNAQLDDDNDLKEKFN